MIYKRSLGVFDSLESVWEAYPSGGLEGDFLAIDGQLYVWNVALGQWTLPSSTPAASSAPRTTKVVDGDLEVYNDLTIGGILNARVIRGRSAFAGLFETVEELNASHPNPYKGQWALVMIENRTSEDVSYIGTVYSCETDGTWTDGGYNVTFDAYDVITDVEMDAVLGN